MSGHRWGIDMGGTKIESVILDASAAVVPESRRRLATEREKGYAHILDRFDALLTEVSQATGLPRPARIGLGMPGSVREDGRHANANTQVMNGRPFVADLEARIGCAVKAANDANCFALAEATLGAAKGFGVVFGVILGTGVGGGIVVDGRVLNGRHGIAGEWGHNPLSGTTLGYSGRRGIVETVVSGPALEGFYREATGRTESLARIAKLAEDGDLAAMQTLWRLRSELGKGLGAIINVLDPDAIVLGGGVGNLDLLYSDAFRDDILKHCFTDRLETAILRPALGDSAGVFGAAMLL